MIRIGFDKVTINTREFSLIHRYRLISYNNNHMKIKLIVSDSISLPKCYMQYIVIYYVIIFFYIQTHTYICTLILAALYINIIYYFTLFSEKYLKIYLLSVSYYLYYLSLYIIIFIYYLLYIILFIILFYILFIYYYYILFINLFTICFIHRIYIIYLHFRDKFCLLEMKFTVVI